MWDAKHNLGYTRYTLNRVERVADGPVIGETRWMLYINRRQWLTFMCTPLDLHHLALGFMHAEGIIGSLEDVLQIKVYESAHKVYWLAPQLGLNRTLTMQACENAVGVIDARVDGTHEPDFSRRVLTSGCGGGISFDELTHGYGPLETDYDTVISVSQVLDRVKDLNQAAQLYRACRGVHTSALSDGYRLLFVSEDVGRHNTIDRIRGQCLLGKFDTTGHILLTTGRISSEMLTKARGMEVPIVVSRTSPTALAVELAAAWNITVIGYARGNQMNVYTGERRIQVDESLNLNGRSTPSFLYEE